MSIKVCVTEMHASEEGSRRDAEFQATRAAELSEKPAVGYDGILLKGVLFT